MDARRGAGALFTHGVGWLRRAGVLLPGITVLIRLVVTVRETAAERMHAALAAAALEADPVLPGRLLASLSVSPGSPTCKRDQSKLKTVNGSSAVVVVTAVAFAASPDRG